MLIRKFLKNFISRVFFSISRFVSSSPKKSKIKEDSHDLYTIGHSNRSLKEFLDLLKQYHINAVCDVRSTPHSSKFPQFNQKSLAQDLSRIGVSYVFLGDELGGRPDDPRFYINGKVSYREIAASPLFNKGLGRIRSGLEKNFLPVLMCSEKDPVSCH